MIALAGHPLGVRTTVLDPAADPCAAQVCGHVQGEFDDFQALYKLAQASDVVTYEFENVPVETARWLEERVPVYPPPRALEVSQDRFVEKSFFKELGVPTPPFAAVESRTEFDAALKRIGLPAVLKTRRFGYDGKGQAVLRTSADVAEAWAALAGRPLILEGFAPFSRELSTVAVRGRSSVAGVADPGGVPGVSDPGYSQRVAFYPLVQNEHRDGMLHRTTAPAPDVPPTREAEARKYAKSILDALGYVGVLAVEWFEVNGSLVANEFAPRVHNSGHWSIEGAECSQFENHVRAIFGWPLGSTKITRSCEMLNLIGDHPPFEEVLKQPGAHLHWYGKTPRPRRKIGHITYFGGSVK
jgi:5-(carboxyamino)imidazole ribonucleotide synthase